MKKIAAIVLLIVIALIATYKYIYKEHRDIAKEHAAFTISATSIIGEFANNPEEAQQKYLNKTVEVIGEITQLNNDQFTLNNGIYCLVDYELSNSIKLTQTITIKGRFIGYDDLLEEIKLDQCVLINN